MFTLAHVSDPHLGPLPRVRLRELASKRAFGYVNWRGNRTRTFEERYLIALIDDLHKAKPDHTAEMLIRDADAALYQAKSEGRSRLSVFNPTLRHLVRRRLRLEH